jgi:hypothetical protein
MVEVVHIISYAGKHMTFLCLAVDGFSVAGYSAGYKKFLELAGRWPFQLVLPVGKCRHTMPH